LGDDALAHPLHYHVLAIARGAFEYIDNHDADGHQVHHGGIGLDQDVVDHVFHDKGQGPVGGRHYEHQRHGKGQAHPIGLHSFQKQLIKL
jgi:hypothetical protein